MILPILAAALTMVVGAGLLYLSTRHQAALARPLGRPARWTGALAVVASLLFLLSFMGSATAVFTWLTVLMVLWSLPPVVIRWLGYRRENKA